MITLKPQTADLIQKEMESIPEKYQKPFNSMHEGLGVLREEYVELEQEIFFGEKKVKEVVTSMFHGSRVNWTIDEKTDEVYKERVRREAIQVAAMACRIIQELT